MSVDDEDPVLIDTLRAIRDAVVAGDDARAEQLAAALDPSGSVERAVVTALDRVRYEYGTYRRFTGGLIRWLRRAAGDSQTWALGRIGVEAWPELSLGGRSAYPGDVTAEPEIDAEEAARCLAIAAARGHRRAAFRLGTLESLLTAYGDGAPDELVDPGDLRSIEARIAVQLADADDPRAGVWFRRAIASPRWEDKDGEATWLWALSHYGVWAHKRGDVELCAQISGRVIDDAVLEGHSDRLAMFADAHKPYRYAYSLAHSNESVRWRTMEHVLTEHDMSPDAGVELLRFLSRNHFFRPEERDLAAAVWTRRYGAIKDPGAVESQAWELIGWLLVEVVPSVLRVVGCDEHAANIQDRLVSIDFSANGFWKPTLDDSDRARELWDRYWGVGEPLDDLETDEYWAFTSPSPGHPLDKLIDELIDPLRAVGWRAVESAAAAAEPGRRHNLRRRRRPVERVGLERKVSRFEIGLRPWPSVGDDRLLAGSDVWLAMWLATTTPPPDGWTRSLHWHQIWDYISPFVRDYLETAAALVSGGRPADSVDRDLMNAYDAVEEAIADGLHQRVTRILGAAKVT